MAKGYLTLVLHCHLPYVRHPEHEHFLEEDWLHEAVAETYVPLLHVLERLASDGVPFRITLSLSPTLCEMLDNELLQSRCARYLDQHVELARKEVERKAGTPFEAAAELYLTRYRDVRETFEARFGRQLLTGFRALARAGRIELIGSDATHALLPVLNTEDGRRAQVAVGLSSFEQHFGGRPQGFWLPECAYEPGIDDLLAEFGIDYFFLETHGVLLAEPRPPYGVFAPLHTPGGPAAFARDVESSRQVWSGDEGYPGDSAYREFYRDLGYDAELDYIRPYLPDGERRYLGFKYHRITGDVPLEEKEPYDPGAARETARRHARHFVEQRSRQVGQVADAVGINPVIVCPYDAELFGHWWFEGPWFLEAMAREAAGRNDLEWLTAGDYLRVVENGGGPRQSGQPAFSTWGDKGYLEVWVNGSNDWIYERLEPGERAMIAAARRHAEPDALTERVLNQCARELLLAQAGDWPFLMTVDTARQYAEDRFKVLMHRFETLMEQVRAGAVDERFLAACEHQDDAFPRIDYRVFQGSEGQRRD
jgi:1,4-alpha-glucan branching enzyme